MDLNKQNIPNYLTYGRVLSVPLTLVLIMWAPDWLRPALFVVFLLAAITDFFDGYLARKWNVESFKGALLDPIADKLLVTVMLLFIITHEVIYTRTIDMNFYAGSLRISSPTTVDDTLYGYILFLPTALILLREIYIAGLREFLSMREVGLPVSGGGKWKTMVQMAAVGTLLFAFAWPHQKIWQAGEILLWIAAALAVITAADYTRKAWPHLK